MVSYPNILIIDDEENFRQLLSRIISLEGFNVLQAATISHGLKIIKQEKNIKIFDKFFQVPGSSNNGTGLGLAIAKEFIDAQNGQIGLKSELGQGTTFYFALKSI